MSQPNQTSTPVNTPPPRKGTGTGSSQGGQSQSQSQNGAATDAEMNYSASPTKMSRIHEKTTLGLLNNRLAVIIERNKQLENENKGLTNKLKIEEEKVVTQVTQCKLLTTNYDAENSKIKEDLKQTTLDKEKFRLNAENLKKDLDETLEKLKKRDSEVASLDKRLSGLESKLNEAHIQHKKMADDLSKAGKVKKDLEEQCTKLHRDLQGAREETKAVCCEKVELENKIRNVQQEGERAIKVVEEKYSVILAKKEVEIGEFRERNDSENKAKLDEALDALRAECDQRLQDVMSEQENLRKIREKDVAAQVNRFNEAMTARNGEFVALNVKLNAEAKKVSVLEGERLTFQKDLAAAKKRIDELEQRVENVKDKWEKNLQQLESEKEGLLNEFNDLLNVKIALDNEISMYRQLLENEEQRLNITPTPTKRKIEEVVPPEEQTAPKKKVVEVVPPQEEQETPKSDRPKRHRPSKH